MARLDKPLPFGSYELLRRIGAGGMGEVFLARKPDAKAAEIRVVKKILPHLSEDQGFVGRFQDEGKVVIHLDHPNICRVYEMGEVDGQFFMAMEYVEGKTLQKVQSRLREINYSFPVELALWVGIRTLEGLAHAHQKMDPEGRPLQVVHRDISPSNVMLTYEGAVKIIDFGAALSTLKEEMTAPRVVIGNLSYMAPEHARKQHVDHRADLFSVGVVLWELLAWQVVPADGDPIERWKRAARPSFMKPSAFRQDLPPGVDDVVMKALNADPRDRYPDAETFRKALLELLASTGRPADEARLGAFMRSLFQAECDAERAIVAEASGLDGSVTGPVTDPFNTGPAGGRSEPTTPRPLLGATEPAMAALDPGRLVTDPGDPARRATLPGAPPINLESLSVEATVPGPTLGLLAEGLLAEDSVSTQSGPKRRRMERTPTRMRQTWPPYAWAAVGVGLGLFLVGLFFALVH